VVAQIWAETPGNHEGCPYPKLTYISKKIMFVCDAVEYKLYAVAAFYSPQSLMKKPLRALKRGELAPPPTSGEVGRGVEHHDLPQLRKVSKLYTATNPDICFTPFGAHMQHSDCLKKSVDFAA